MERYCTVCREPIADEHRLRIASPYCSKECKAKSDNARREASRRERCESCGRRYRNRPTGAGQCIAVAASQGFIESLMQSIPIERTTPKENLT